MERIISFLSTLKMTETVVSGKAKLSHKIIDNFEIIISGVLLLLVFAIVVANILTRLISGATLIWAEEVTGILFIWSIFFGAAAGVHQGALISIDFFTQYLPLKIQKTLMLLVNIVIMLFIIFLCYEGMVLALNYTSDTLPMSNLSSIYLYLALPVGFFFILLRVLQNFITLVKS